MSIKVYFDLDGTLYDLYGIDNWLDRLEREEAGLFNQKDNLLYNSESLSYLITNLLKQGVEFGVISWLPMNASPEYEEICRAEKIEWIHENLPFVSEINIVPYGTVKQKAIRKRTTKMYLIDDNEEVCTMWNTAKQRKAYCVSSDDISGVYNALRCVCVENNLSEPI